MRHFRGIHRLLRSSRGAAAGLTLTLAACNSLSVPDLNNPGRDNLLNNPTVTSISQAATGLLIGARTGIAPQNGYVSLLGVLGRESYNFDSADPRFITEMLIGPLDGGSPAFGGNHFVPRYSNIRNALTLLAAVDKIDTGLLSDARKNGLRGFAKTIEALDLLEVINTRDINGAPIDLPADLGAPPAPIATKAEVFARIEQLLDDGAANLAAADAAFGFPLGAGFTGFDTPATFLKVNRALRARVAVYRADYATALTALGASFLSTSAPLTLGAYHIYGTGSGDESNSLNDPNGRAIYAHPSILTDAQLQAGGAPDLRTAKVTAVASKTVQGVTSNLLFTLYTSPSSTVPIIRNEELILLRAEANIGLNTAGSLAAAVTDLNLIRTTAGGLPPYAGPVTQPALLDELLYNKRYSLLFEGGHRWIDLRRYNRLTDLPLALPTHKRFAKFPFPINECNARTPAPAQGCSPEPGF